MKNIIKKIVQFLLIFLHTENEQNEIPKTIKEVMNNVMNYYNDIARDNIEDYVYFPGTISFSNAVPVKDFGEQMLYARTHKRYLRSHHLGKYRKTSHTSRKSKSAPTH